MVRTSQRYVPVALFILAALVLGARLLHQTTKSDAPAKSSLIRWHTPKEGLRLAATTGRPLLFDFTAEWCGPCHMLDDQVFQDPAIARAINERFIPVRVVDRQREEGSNPPEVEELQRTYNVRGFPTVVFAASAGAERQRMEGFRGRAEFARLMERAR